MQLTTDLMMKMSYHLLNISQTKCIPCWIFQPIFLYYQTVCGNKL